MHEDIEPPGVPAAGDPHVIRHDVDEEAQAVVPERLCEAAEGCLAPQLSAKAAVVRHIVAMRAIRAGFEKGRNVAVAYAERCEVRYQGCHVIEGQIRTELEPIGGPRHAQQ